MPKSIDWLGAAPEALKQLQAMSVKVVDRATIEQLFKIHRRTAIRIMHRFGGQQAGKTFLIDREQLVEKLQVFLQQDSEQGPSSRTPSQIRRLYPEAETFRFPDVRAPERRTLARLPSRIRIVPGKITVEAASLEELCMQLWVLLETCNEDRQVVEAQLEGERNRAN